MNLSRRQVLKVGTAAAATAPLLAAQAAPAEAAPLGGPQVRTNVVVVGGGAAGLHTAYQLSKLPANHPDADVCLVEANRSLGGRIHDVALDPAQPDLMFGTGALRVMETQDYVFGLAEELGITLVESPWRDDLISARGYFANVSDDLNEAAYPLVTKEHLAGGGFDTETALYDELRFGALRGRAGDYPDFRSYARAALGTQGSQFLADMLRFRADFTVSVDARGYLDYLDEEWDVCCTPSYPVGGMSQFILRMADAARKAGVRFFLGDPVVRISRARGEYRYLVETGGRTVRAKKLVIAVDPHGMAGITGPVADELKGTGQFGDLLGVKVVTVSQRWPTAWWLNLAPSGLDLRRAWTTEHALNALEIPISPYAADQKVTRTVYDDHPVTVEFWEQTAGRGIGHVEAEIMRGLNYLFPEASIPDPLNTVVRVWPAGWYWLRGGTPYTNADIADWAVAPLRGEPVSLVGEAYNPQRSGWSDAAYKSSIRALNERFGTGITFPRTPVGARGQRGCGHRNCRRHARA